MKKILTSILCFFFIFIWWIFADESKSCSWSIDKNNFCSPVFEIKVNTFSPGGDQFTTNSLSTKNKILLFFTTTISKLMVALWVISLLIMSIWAGYMIFYHGQDEYLSKWKSIFMSGIIALIVALSSYYLVSLLRFILYKN